MLDTPLADRAKLGSQINSTRGDERILVPDQLLDLASYRPALCKEPCEANMADVIRRAGQGDQRREVVGDRTARADGPAGQLAAQSCQV